MVGVTEERASTPAKVALVKIGFNIAITALLLFHPNNNRRSRLIPLHLRRRWQLRVDGGSRSIPPSTWTPFGSEAVGVAGAVTLEQAVALEFA